MADVPANPDAGDGKDAVNRTRRAIFAFLATLGSLLAIIALATIKFPVSTDLAQTAVRTLGQLGTFIGIGYIGGSVIDYSGLFSSLAGKFGGARRPVTENAVDQVTHSITVTGTDATALQNAARTVPTTMPKDMPR